jgi:hypothetical protein
MATYILISYRRADTEFVATALHDKLVEPLATLGRQENYRQPTASP